ncbi:MAG: NUDIX domain-containing protein [Caldilineaceae bacterium]
MANVLEKVTAFVVRIHRDEHQLLLFEHPTAGIQVPAGTVEAGEAPATAALREAQEETGLAEFTGCHYLATTQDRLAEDEQVIFQTTPIYGRPAADAIVWATLRNGLRVKVVRQQDSFTQVTYQEYDRVPDPTYVSLSITGWAPASALATMQVRHFYLLPFAGASAARWQVHNDHYWFTLFWAPLHQLPPLVPPQQPWLSYIERYFNID